MAYASETTVSPESSRAEIERTLARYGAGAFGYMTNGNRAHVIFEAQGRRVRLVVDIPPIEEFLVTSKGRRRGPSEASSAQQQASRQRWRALALVVKAKLEAVSSGVSTFEDEFLPYIMMPNGKTVGEMVAPEIKQAYESGKMPQLLLGH